MDCSRCVSKDAEIALLKERIADQAATIAEDKKTIALLLAQIPTTTRSESTSAAPPTAEFINRGAPFDDAHLGREDEEEREAELAAALPSFDSTFVNGAFLSAISFRYSNAFVAKYNFHWNNCRDRYDKLSNSCKRVFWFFFSLKNTMLEEKEAARSRFSNVVNSTWLASLLDLAELKHVPKKAGECWLASKALDGRRDFPLLNTHKYEQ